MNNLLLKIFQQNNINFPEGEENHIEYLQNRYTNNFFFIDFCPFSVEKKYSNKYNQIENFYEDAVRTKNLKAYNSVEDKYIKIIQKLWLYNSLSAFSEINNIANQKYKPIKNKFLRKQIKKITKQKNYKNIQQISEMSELIDYVKISARNIIDVDYYFEEYGIIISPLWSCFAIYFFNLDYFEIVEKIVNVEGLYLRKLAQTNRYE